MSYDYGLTASGFAAGPNAYDYLTEEQELKIASEIKLSKLKNLTYLCKITANAKSTEDFVNICLKVAGARLTKQAVARYCYLEKLPKSLVSSTWDSTNLGLIIKQFIMALNINTSTEDSLRLQSLVSKILDNVMEETVYQRVGYIQSFVNKMNRSNVSLDKELMRQLLSISRLFINVIELQSLPLKQRYHQYYLTSKMVEIEKTSNLTSFKGKRYIKNWKLRHLRDISYYADEKRREGYRQLLELDLNKSIAELREEAHNIFYSNIRLI